jgi:hypothetical protein
MPENKIAIDLRGWDLFRAAKENRAYIARALIARGDDVDPVSKAEGIIRPRKEN